MGKRWYAARTQPGMARVAEKELTQPTWDHQPFRTLLPLWEGRSVFGPYFFIEFDVDLDFWEDIYQVRGISRLLPVGCAKPLPLPPGFIDDVRERMAIGDFGPKEVAEVTHAWAKGEHGQIMTGLWEGHSGAYTGRKKGFVKIELVVFGRAFEIPIPAHQVKPIAADPITKTNRVLAPQYRRRERARAPG